ncbi:tripartite tricarboxylate transporter substrate binding protein [Hydrogenophaga sp.]|uniref:Bug family tripartite tricarboxylate transporter substrate binding protein n=1 Tax=Hydrogenophaga sp. TaxID=1904254 RepID=UPI00271CD523|nr:tripartite tricarboxylate transporter substrate binding protein [Hydrogenophaga sp.]MDO9435476.1 tripartite tricarboxylate transporter substrate binding protein [Hydrogenophaga sp.]
MTIRKRQFLLTAAFTAATAGFALPAAAQAYPNKPIKMVVGFAAGGPTDLVARTLAADMSKSLGQPVVVENRPGATGRIAEETVARDPGDGYTLLLDSQTLITNPLTMSKVLFNPLRDFVPISRVAALPLILLASPNLPANNAKELVAMAKADKSSVNYGSAGVAGSGHLAGALLSTTAGVEMLHIPFKGQAPALAEVMSGRVQFIFYAVAGAKEQVDAKRVKALAVTSTQRLPQFPDVPTMSESGFPGFEVTTPWLGLVAPAGTPPAITRRLNEAVRSALNAPETQQRLAALGAIPEGNTQAEFAKFLQTDFARWEKLIKTTGIRAD